MLQSTEKNIPRQNHYNFSTGEWRWGEILKGETFSILCKTKTVTKSNNFKGVWGKMKIKDVLLPGASREVVEKIILDEIGRFYKYAGTGLYNIKPHHNLRDDLDFDSLDAIELIMSLEEKLGIEISDDQAETWRTVAEVLKGVLELKPEKNKPPKKTIRTASTISERGIRFTVEGKYWDKRVNPDWFFRFRIPAATQAEAAQKLIDFIKRDLG